jgi:hypothetical protein
MVGLKRSDFDSIEKKLQLDCRNANDRLCWFIHEGKRVVFTRRSHAKGDLPASDQIRQQLRVNEVQLRGLVDCSFSRNDYVSHLKQRGVIVTEG